MARQTGHHTVPQFYLRRFANPEDQGDARLIAWDKSSEDPLPPQRVNNLAKIRDFYAIPSGIEADMQALEHGLAKFESAWADALRVLDTGDPLSPDTRFLISQFVALQFVRTTRARKLVSRARIDWIKRSMMLDIRMIKRQHGPDGVRRFIRSLLRDGSAENERLDQLASMIERDTYHQSGIEISVNSADHLNVIARTLDGNSSLIADVFQREWTILMAARGAMFVTSDSPVSLTMDPAIGRADLRTAESVFLPLAADTCLQMKLGATRFRDPMELDVAAVVEINYRVVEAADKWVYMNPDTSRRWRNG